MRRISPGRDPISSSVADRGKVRVTIAKAGTSRLDPGPQHVQFFPAALRGQHAQLELFPDQGTPGGGEFILPDAPEALQFARRRE